MYIIRVSIGGWSHKMYVLPDTIIKKIALKLRGYKRLDKICTLGRRGYYSHEKYKQK